MTVRFDYADYLYAAQHKVTTKPTSFFRLQSPSITHPSSYTAWQVLADPGFVGRTTYIDIKLYLNLSHNPLKTSYKAEIVGSTGKRISLSSGAMSTGTGVTALQNNYVHTTQLCTPIKLRLNFTTTSTAVDIFVIKMNTSSTAVTAMGPPSQNFVRVVGAVTT